MHLSHLDADISATILRRGQAYADDGLVLALAGVDSPDGIDGLESAKGTGSPVQYEAQVQGTRLYRVSVELLPDGTVLAYRCSCPFDGPVCKHVAAVLLVLRSGGGATSATGSDAVRPSSIEELLADEPRDVLMELLVALAARSPAAAQQIRLRVGPPNPEGTLAECRQLLQRAIHQQSDGYGFLEYAAVGGVVESSEAVRDIAAAAAVRDPVLAVDIYLLLVEELVRLLQMADDSDGLLGGFIEDNVSAIDHLAVDENLSTDTRRLLFEHLLQFVGRPFLADWPDWEIAIAATASRLVSSSVMREAWERRFAGGPPERGHSYRAEQLDLLRHAMIGRLDGPAEADTFLLGRLHHPTFREAAIRDALGDGRYDEALALADAGIEADLAQNLWGLVTRWQQLKYEAAHQSGHEDLARQTARELFLGGQTAYYDALKSAYSIEVWELVWRGMLDELELEDRLPGAAYLHIISQEHDTPRILQYCRRYPRALERFLGDLLPAHREEVAELWRRDVVHQAEMASTRTAYQALAQTLRRMAGAGLHDEAQTITNGLLAQYPRKRALREELQTAARR